MCLNTDEDLMAFEREELAESDVILFLHMILVTVQD